MTPAELHELYRRWLDELWGGRPDAAGQLASQDFVGHWPDREVRGPAALQAIVDQTRAMFDTITFELAVGPIADGDHVAARWTGVGTTSEGTSHFFGNDLLRVEGGRVIEYWPASSAG